ncbi:lipid-A-disaccharide synthase [Thiothrix nivea]|uniref:Lipid-A-disaccharide synthase n=1 Tax=Thiothrix nivea (strain ATCC 35100 / DSM 5205 / JP2) TaxID=870187 RepID=A0A656HLS8_THINJ|nr:lipid-A-disaccharide synthase [Thiothrix nivea]EIJ36476.1 lipid-A-disaccharide synthase [Thiothrix nivea DSM 5205]
MKRIAIIAGEASGDLLAARLILALRAQAPHLQFEGIAGPEMLAAGCIGLFPLEKFSVMGLVEVLPRLPELLSIRKRLLQRWLADPPDLFIGVDAPDLNLPIEKKLHAAGVPTVHYVSPSVWAWRAKRVRKMRGNLDLMLALFPFEVDFYRQHGIPAEFVGHPLADEVEFDACRSSAREQLGLPQDRRILAILPGSRRGEVRRMAFDFLQAAEQLRQRHPDLLFATPAINRPLRDELETIRQQAAPGLPLTVLDGQSRTLMQVADYILMASGTAVLEGMLAGRLMVAAYRVAPLTAWIIRTFKLLKVRFVTLPNNLANEALVPEFLQEAITPDNLAQALEQLFALPDERRAYILQRFHELHGQLRKDASHCAASVILRHFQHNTQE